MVAAVLIGGVLALALAVPLAWKWELGVPRSAVAVGVIAVGVALLVLALDSFVGLATVVAVLLTVALTLAIAAGIVLWRFFRDPERTTPDGDDTVYSPADGLVIYVHRSERGELPVSTKQGRNYALDELVRTPLDNDDAIVVGIALSFLDVHVNRSPIAGAVRVQQRFPGPFASLKHPSAVYTNERSTTLLERDGLQVAVVLIASRLVRRIVSYVKQGEHVAAGQRIGAIRFGSQVDVVMPDTPGLRVVVEPGERVWAGETPIAEIES